MRFSRLLFVAVILMLAAGTALADDFTLTADTTPAISITFSLPATPTSVTPLVDGSGFSVSALVTVYGDSALLEPAALYTVDFYNAAGGGGLDITNGLYLVNVQGPQLFVGSLANPTFLTGADFELSAFPDPALAGRYNPADLDITASATPEPGSLLLFGTGIAGFLGAVRRKFAR